MNDFAYTTLSNVKQNNNLADAGLTASDDSALQDFIYIASDAINDYTGTWFTPTIETFDYDVNHVDRYNGLLNLNRDLQTLNAVSIDDTAQTLSDYRKSPENSQPANYVYSAAWSQSTPDAIGITGVWCFHDRYNTAYRLQGTLISGVTDSDTVIPVVETGLETGQLLRINDELMQVVSTATNAVTVTRGVFGSIAAAHLLGDTVEYFQPMRTIQQACTRLAAFMWVRRGGFEAYTFQPDGTAVTFPSDLPSDVKGLLDRLNIGLRISTV